MMFSKKISGNGGQAAKNEFLKEKMLGDKKAGMKTFQYVYKCIDPENARLYGSFDQRASLNITQFPKIQGSLLIRMGIVYPIVSYIVKKIGVPPEASSDVFGLVINYHTWVAGYLSYLLEIQLGLSKYPIEWVQKGIARLAQLFRPKQEKGSIPEE